MLKLLFTFLIVVSTSATAQDRSVSIPIEYVYTNGASTPRFPDQAFGLLYLFSHDFDADGCDDVLASFGDSYSSPGVIFGGKGGYRFRHIGLPKTRHLRNIGKGDLNGDGIVDLVGFTAPHGFKMKELGRNWDFDEPDFVHFSGPGGASILLRNETSAHGGLVGDLDGDGDADILPIDEENSSKRQGLLIESNPFKIKRGKRLGKLSRYRITDARSADLDGDGRDDFVFTIAKRGSSSGGVSPASVAKSGSFAVALGQKGRDVSRLRFKTYGSPYLSADAWSTFRASDARNKQASADFSQNKAGSAPSNIELLDFDQDGDLDVFIGYYVEAGGSWRSAGFQLWQNTAGEFRDVTSTYAPNQTTLKTMSRTIGFILGAGMADVNRDGRLDLIVTMKDSDRMSSRRTSGSIYINRNGRFVPASGSGTRTNGYSSLIVGDFNCNGRPDVAGIGNRSQNRIKIGFFLN